MKKKVSLLFLAVLLMISSFYLPTYEASSIKEKEEKIKELEQKRHELKKNEKTINEKKSETSEKIEQNTKKQSSIQSELSILEESLQATEQKITNKEKEIFSLQKEINGLVSKVNDIEAEIEQLHNQIIELETEIEDVTLRMEKRENLLRERLRSMQFSGGAVTYLEVFLGAKSFTDLIGRVAAVNTIMKQDQVLIDEHKADKLTLETNVKIVSDKQVELNNNKKEIIVKKEEIEDSKRLLEAEKVKLVALKRELDEQSKQKERLLVQLQREEEELREYEISLEDEQKIIAAQASALEKAKQLAQKEKERLVQLAKEEEERKKREEEERKNQSPESGNSGNDGGQHNSPPPEAPVPSGDKIFLRPTTGPITSHYGMRTYPRNRMHYGIDFGNSIGTPILAAAAGVVSNATYMGEWGNTIVITHYINGQTYSTLYAHLNGFNVSAGQVVQAGQQIGTMGSTGFSTGPHLHFEVHKGGFQGYAKNAVNPYPYLINP